MTCKRLAALSIVVALAAAAAPCTEGAELTHPRLMADSNDIARAREWIREYPWYRQIFERNREEIDRFIRQRPIFVSPIKQTYRYKMYTCPRHDVELLYEEFRPFEHRCPRDTTEVYSGGSFDMAWSGWYNRQLASHLLWMGLLYQVYGDERYAEAGRELLLRFAELYLQYPTENTILGPAHVFFGTLSESFWGVDMAYGYDLLYNYQGFTAQDRAAIKEKLFIPLAKITQLFPESASNRQLWYNNVSAAVGFLFGDRELIDFALNAKYGFDWQLGSALPESGFWAEWSGYHFVALRGMIHLAEMARHNGLDLYHRAIAGRSMKKMFDAPFAVILANNEFPRSKDSGGGNILEYAVFYEVGFAVYRDPRYAALLNLTNISRGKQVVGEESGARSGEAPITLFTLVPEIPNVTVDIYPEQSANIEGNGFAILRNGTGKDRRYLYLDYGIMGGEHGHPDRLQIGYYARGRNWIVDPLNESYFNPNLQLWYRQTIAHNTVVLDQTSQTWSNGYGNFFGANLGFQVASGGSSTIYPGSVLTRTVLQAGDYFIDLCDVTGQDGRTIDWPLHSFGSVTIEGVALRNEPRDLFGHPPGVPGYDQMREIRSGTTDSSWSAVFKADGEERLLVLGVGEAATQLFQAMTPPLGGFYKQMVTDRSPLPMIMSRRITRATRFAHLIHAFESSPSVSSISKGTRPGTYQVRHAGGEDVILADVTNGTYWMVRSSGAQTGLVSGYRVKEIMMGDRPLLSSETTLAIVECTWHQDTLSIQIPDPFVRLTIYDRLSTTVRVNGIPAEFRREGERIIVQRHMGPVLELLSPADSTLYLGLGQDVKVRVWNPSEEPLEGALSLALAPDWKERVRSQVEWWGGVVNLLPLNKNSIQRLRVPSSVREDASWIDGVTAAPVAVPPRSSRVITVKVSVPNDAAAVLYPATFRFSSGELRRSLKVAPPIVARLDIPNGTQQLLQISLSNALPEPADVSLSLRPTREWKIGGTLPAGVTIPAHATKTFKLPITLTGYNPRNQLYPVSVRIGYRGFQSEIERDFFVGVARAAEAPPSLDGSWKGWDRSSPMTIDSPNQISKLLFGNQPWGGRSDFSASLYAMYDREYLYVGAAVNDNRLVTHWDFPAMSYPWDTDCMEVVLDTRTTADQHSDPPTPGIFRHLSMAEYRTTTFDADMWQGAGAGGPLLPKPSLVAGAETFFAPAVDGYTLICRYPLRALRSVQLRPGCAIGFDVALSDNDGTAYRKNQYIWAGYGQNQSWWDMGTIGVLLFGQPKARAGSTR